MTLHRLTTVLALSAALVISASLAAAGELTKEECLDAHSRGQDAKEQNKLSLARKLFLTCAQSSCPTLVQGDCARFADELTRMQPSVTFVARDGNGVDLPDTTVYVDGLLVATRLDGAPHDLDPGSHTVRFDNNMKQQTVTVVIGSGEKGRTVVATFGSPPAAPPPALAKPAQPPSSRLVATTSHPTGATLLFFGGVAGVAVGGVLGVAGALRVPSDCSLSTHQCAAPPGDPSLRNAASAIKMMDIGIGVGIASTVAIAAGAYWYMTGAKTHKERVAVTPWISPAGGGLALGGDL